MAYGVSAKSVCVDGVYLPEIDELDGSVGFYKDNSGKTVIVLPSKKWKQITIENSKMQGERNNVAADATFTDSKNDKENTVLASLKNEEHTYEWKVTGTGKNSYLQAELDKKYNIDSMVLKWGSGYASEYIIEVSDDGESWSTVYEAAEATGGIENISFEPVKAKYVRISGMKRGGNTAASLYNVSIYETLDSGLRLSLKGTSLYYGLSVAAVVVTGGSVPLLMAVALMLILAIAATVTITVIKLKGRKKAIKE